MEDTWKGRGAAVSPSALAVALLFTGCGASESPGPQMTQYDSSGVRVIQIVGELQPLDWHIEPRFRLGGHGNGPESFYQVTPALVAVGNGGEIHVLDPAHHRIVSFSPTGEFLRSIGRSGNGPAEFRQPFALALSGEGDFVVADRGRRGLVRLDPTGEAKPLIEVDAPIYGAAGVTMAGITPVFTMFNWSSPNGGTESLLWGDPPRRLASVELQGPSTGRFPSCPGAFVGLPFLARGLLWATSRSGVVLSPSLEYEIRVFEGGELRVVLRRDFLREPATPAAVAEEVGEVFEARTGRGTCAVPIEEALRIKGHISEVPAIAAVAHAPCGRIWVRRGNLPENDAAIDIFEADGTPVGTLPPGTPFPVAFTAGGFVSAEEDGFGVQRLVVHDVRERDSRRR